MSFPVGPKKNINPCPSKAQGQKILSINNFRICNCLK